MPRKLTEGKPLSPRKRAEPPPAPEGAEPPDDRYVVVRDTREKDGHGWTWPEGPACKGTVLRAMKTGDYTLVGYEDVLTIDRKGCISEFATNLTEARFERELDRMAAFAYPAIFLEFEFEKLWMWPRGSGVPAFRQRTMRLTRHVLLARFWALQLKYPHVRFHFVGPHGKEAASSLFKRVIESHGRRDAATG